MAEQYKTTKGDVITYPKPAPAVVAFLERALAAANDPRVSERELTGLVFGAENPLLDRTILAGRAVVTSEMVENPLYLVFLDVLRIKSRNNGTLAFDHNAREPVLRLRMGHEPGRSFRVKASHIEEKGRRHKHIVDGVVERFDRAAISVSNDAWRQVLLIAPHEALDRIDWGPFFVTGKFRVLERITGARAATRTWETFQPE